MRLLIFIFGLIFSVNIFAKNNYLEIQTWKTQAGSAVYFVRTTALPIVDVSTVFNAGSAFDQNNFGLASLTNSFIGEQTKDLNPTQIAEKINASGMVFDSNADRDKSVIHFRSLTDKKYFDPSLSLYIDILSNLSISADTFSRVKSQTISNIKSELEDPSNLAVNAFFNALYGNSPYGHPIDGDINSVNSLTLNEVNQFYLDHYTAKNAFIAIVGDVDLAQAKLIAENISSHLPSGNLIPEPLNKPKLLTNKNIFIRHPGSQNTIIIGQIGIAHSDARLIPLEIANTILGDMGMSSLLMETVRNQNGFVYYVDSSISALKNPGPFFIVLQTKAETSAQATNLTKDELLKYAQNGPSAAQLEASKKYLVGSFPFSYATNNNILTNVINIAFFNLPLNYLDTYQNRVAATSLDKIHDDFKQLIKPEDLITVTVGQKTKSSPVLNDRTSSPASGRGN